MDQMERNQTSNPESPTSACPVNHCISITLWPLYPPPPKDQFLSKPHIMLSVPGKTNFATVAMVLSVVENTCGAQEFKPHSTMTRVCVERVITKDD